VRFRRIARLLREVADEIDPQREPPFKIEAAAPGTEPEQFAAPGSTEETTNRTLAQIYLARALRRYSPTERPAHA
jgi:hypothetical protein